jgi:hypothetical protein
MGREIRRVPPNWEHPRSEQYGKEGYQPMCNRKYSEAAEEWMHNCLLWQEGKHPSQEKGWGKDYKYYWEYEGKPPDKKYYLPDGLEEPTWYQMYETVSEGTPVSPPFATKEELVEYLVENGDFWDQRHGSGGYDRKTAEAFVDEGWAPSFIRTADGRLLSGVEASVLAQKEED